MDEAVRPSERDSQMSNASNGGDSASAFTIAIYQDPSHIEGILQQSNRGLLTGSSDSDNSRRTQASKTGTGGQGEMGADFRVPGIGGVQARAKLSADDGNTYEGVADQQMTRTFKYTSAYYLHHVRQDLRAAGLLKKVATAADLATLSIGDFIEFQASFSPDELISLMDVFNPDLIAALTRWFRKSRLISQIAQAETDEQRQALAVEYQTRPDADADAVKAIAEAVRVDFRSAATREYYGAIGSEPGLTAVVVCDTRSFLVEDADRILDGHFTVLGKVSTPPIENVPVLARNKVLDRVQPEAVDLFAREIRKAAKQQVQSLNTPGGERMETIEHYLDLNFPSRIDGLSFKVIPIAIYM